jgi:predicted NUDIX family phosphoesterase
MPYKKKGLIKENSELLKSIVQNGLFLRRGELEDNPTYKQIIPYAMISNKGSFYLYKRTSGQTEKRLHNKFSLGVGGHMNPRDPMESKEKY